VEEVGEGRRTVSVCEVWKDVRGGRGDEGLVEGGEVVVEIWRKLVVELLVPSSITKFSKMGLGRSLASGPLPCTRSRSIGSWLYRNSSGE